MSVNVLLQTGQYLLSWLNCIKHIPTLCYINCHYFHKQKLGSQLKVPLTGRPAGGHLDGENILQYWEEFPTPMQLAEACMSAEFINLHLLWAGGEGRRWRSGWGEGGGKQHACRLCFSQTREGVERNKGLKWEKKRNIGEESIKICTDIMFPLLLPAYSLIALSPPQFTFPLRARQTLAFPLLPWACSEGSTGLKSNFNTVIRLPAVISKSCFRFTACDLDL